MPEFKVLKEDSIWLHVVLPLYKNVHIYLETLIPTCCKIQCQSNCWCCTANNNIPHLPLIHPSTSWMSAVLKHWGRPPFEDITFSSTPIKHRCIMSSPPTTWFLKLLTLPGFLLSGLPQSCPAKLEHSWKAAHLLIHWLLLWLPVYNGISPRIASAT